MRRKRWTPDELAYLHAHSTDHPIAIATALGRSRPSVYMRLVREGFRTQTPRVGPSWGNPPRSLVLRLINESLPDGVTVADVFGPALRRSITQVRWAVISKLKARHYSSASIGRALGIDHTSVLYALDRLANGQGPLRGGRRRGRNTHSLHSKKSPLIPYVGYDPSERSLDWR